MEYITPRERLITENPTLLARRSLKLGQVLLVAVFLWRIRLHDRDSHNLKNETRRLAGPRHRNLTR